MKIRETRILTKYGRQASKTLQDRVIEVTSAPEGAEVVNDDTPTHDWQDVSGGH